MNPKYITLHCSATNPAVPFSKEDLHNLHVKHKGWSDIGYHFYITQDGAVRPCRPLSRNGAHVHGRNLDNIGICLEGGINSKGKTVDNFSYYQKKAAFHLVDELSGNFDIEPHNIKGHRDWSPDLNADGKISPNEFIKMCPCFDVQEWLVKCEEGE